MKKRYLIALIVVVAIGIMVGGAVGTGAWFTDTDSIAGNTLAAGKLQIDLRAGGGGAVVPLEVSGMFPAGSSDPGAWVPADQTFVLAAYNDKWPEDGITPLPLKYQLSFANVSASGGTGGVQLQNKLWVHLDGWYAGMATGAWVPVYEGLFNDFLVQSTVNGESSSHNYGILEPNHTSLYRFSFRLDPSAGNNYQGAGVEFDVKIDAYQPNDPVF